MFEILKQRMQVNCLTPTPTPHSIEAAVSFIVTRLSDISQLAAQTDRLDALLSALVAQTEGLPGGIHRCVGGYGWGWRCDARGGAVEEVLAVIAGRSW